MIDTVTRHDTLARIVEIIDRKNAMHARQLRRYLDSCPGARLDSAESYLTLLAEVVRLDGRGLTHLVESYLQVVAEIMAEQIKFLRTGHYSSSEFAEVNERVYGDDEYMDRYMLGLAVSQFFWPNHNAMFNFFAAKLADAPAGDYLEIGPGHGLFLLEAISSGRFDRFTVVDISSASLDICRRLIDHRFGPTMIEIDYLLADVDDLEIDHTFGFAAMGEVLEHVERPDMIMARLFDLVRPGGRAFVSTCANAPAVDHIYLFSRVSEIRDVIASPGFGIEAELVLPYEGRTVEEAEARKLGINYCALLGRPGPTRV